MSHIFVFEDSWVNLEQKVGGNRGNMAHCFPLFHAGVSNLYVGISSFFGGKFLTALMHAQSMENETF